MPPTVYTPIRSLRVPMGGGATGWSMEWPEMIQANASTCYLGTSVRPMSQPSSWGYVTPTVYQGGKSFGAQKDWPRSCILPVAISLLGHRAPPMSREPLAMPGYSLGLRQNYGGQPI